MEIVSLANLP